MFVVCFFFFFKQKTAYEIGVRLVGSEMCIRDRNYPDDGKGDCEDYVLLKRRMLMQAGWPREALLITVVRDKKGDGHAVLTVKTNKGEFILDNQEAQVLAWNKTGYRFVKRQSQSDPNLWVALGEPQGAPATVSAR